MVLLSSSAVSVLSVALWLVLSSARRGVRAGRLQVADGGPVQHVALGAETGAVTGTVPGLLGVVPAHHTAQVRADGGTFVNLTPVVAIDRQLRQSAADHRSL